MPDKLREKFAEILSRIQNLSSKQKENDSLTSEEREKMLTEIQNYKKELLGLSLDISEVPQFTKTQSSPSNSALSSASFRSSEKTFNWEKSDQEESQSLWECQNIQKSEKIENRLFFKEDEKRERDEISEETLQLFSSLKSAAPSAHETTFLFPRSSSPPLKNENVTASRSSVEESLALLHSQFDHFRMQMVNEIAGLRRGNEKRKEVGEEEETKEQKKESVGKEEEKGEREEKGGEYAERKEGTFRDQSSWNMGESDREKGEGMSEDKRQSFQNSVPSHPFHRDGSWTCPSPSPETLYRLKRISFSVRELRKYKYPPRSSEEFWQRVRKMRESCEAVENVKLRMTQVKNDIGSIRLNKPETFSEFLFFRKRQFWPLYRPLFRPMNIEELNAFLEIENENFRKKLQSLGHSLQTEEEENVMNDEAENKDQKENFEEEEAQIESEKVEQMAAEIQEIISPRPRRRRSPDRSR